MNRPRKLLLHIGVHKTGSSAIQAWLAKNADELGKHGIAYRKFNPAAAQDVITSGNSKMLIDILGGQKQGQSTADEEFWQHGMHTYFDGFDTAIISGEGLAGIRGPQIERFKSGCADRQITVTVFAYCRTIYDHAYSAYQQMVKRHGETRTFREFASDYKNPQFQCLMSWHSVFGSALTVRLYDAAKKDLVADFVRMIELDRLPLRTGQENVNRSLTFTELELLRHLNGYHKGTLSRLLSDALIYANPSKKSDYHFDAQIAKDFAGRFKAEVETINSLLFGSRPEKLAVFRTPDSSAGVPTLDPMKSMDPSVETVLKALAENAADANARVTKLGSRLSIAHAKIAMSSEEWDAAAKHLQQALRGDPDNIRVNRQLAQVYAKLGDHERLTQLRQKVTRLERASPTPG